MNPLLKTLASILRVAATTLVLYGVIVMAFTLIPFGGAPMIHRLLPLQNPGGPSHSLARFREASSRGPVDFVFLGSSHSYRGFDPRLFSAMGYSSQNLGSSSQTPLNTLCLLRRYLDVLKPKIVIYEIYQTALSIDGMESCYDLLSNTPVDSATFEMTWNIRQPQAWTALLSTMVRNVRTPFSHHVQRGKEGRDDLYVAGGFVQCTATMPADRLARLRAGPAPVHYPMDARQFDFLAACIDIVRASGATFVACSYPIPAETQRALAGYADKQRQISDFLAAKTVPFHDFNLDMGLDTALHYYDEVHLNQQGVELFNAALVEWLRLQNLLPSPSQKL